MKWFKHYTNAHKGGVLQSLYLEFGVNEGYGLYFRLIEYLADKWDGNAEPKFSVLESELRSFLKLSRKSLRSFAEVFEKFPENSFKVSENFCEIYLPKLLEVRHRDALSASIRPEIIQQKSGVEKKKSKKKNIQEWQQKAFDLLVARFKEFFPGSEKGKNALGRFREHAKDETSAAAIIQSVTHYSAHLKSLDWNRAPKTSVATFLGPIDEPFWAEYRDPKPSVGGNAAGSLRGA